jgi:uncharacterized membrane protein YedE/YeeE
MNSTGKYRLVFLVVGLIFGAGLSISGMVLPEKVIGFFDVAGTWDPSLAFVMVGAILVHAPIVRWIQPRKTSFLGHGLQLPTRKDIDWRLVVGATLFGIGWGLAGVCPGPGIVDLVTLGPGIVAFVAAMLAGMAVEHVFERKILAGRKA